MEASTQTSSGLPSRLQEIVQTIRKASPLIVIKYVRKLVRRNMAGPVQNRFPEATSQKVGQANAAFLLAQQHLAAVRGDRVSTECRRHRRATDGRKIGMPS